MKRYLRVAVYRVVYVVDGVVDALVHRLDAVRDKDLPLQLLRLISARKALDFLYQLVALLVRDEARGLNRVDKKLQLRQLEFAADDMISHALALPLFDVEPEQTEHFNVVVERLALRVDAVFAQRVRYLGERHSVLVVRVFEQDLHQIEQLYFLV